MRSRPASAAGCRAPACRGAQIETEEAAGEPGEGEPGEPGRHERGQQRGADRDLGTGEQPGELGGFQLAQERIGVGGHTVQPLGGRLVGLQLAEAGVEDERTGGQARRDIARFGQRHHGVSLHGSGCRPPVEPSQRVSRARVERPGRWAILGAAGTREGARWSENKRSTTSWWSAAAGWTPSSASTPCRFRSPTRSWSARSRSGPARPGATWRSAPARWGSTWRSSTASVTTGSVRRCASGSRRAMWSSTP